MNAKYPGQVLQWLSLLFLVSITTAAWAQDITFTAQAPKAVSVGENFRFRYVANAQGSSLSPGSFDGFSVLSGPNTSTSTSVQIINGKMDQKMEVSYTYIIRAQKEGTFTISPGKITIDGKEYTSNAVTIKVVKGNAQAAPNAGSSNRSTPQRSTPQGNLSSDDLFLRMLISKREVLQGEPIVATLKLYTRVNLADLGSFKAPSFNGFWSESLRQAQNLSFQKENVNGQVYNTAVIQQHVLIPERSGELTIDPAELTALAQLRVRGQRRRSVFDQFFGNYQNVEKELRSPSVKVKVNALPSGAPAGFNGAIGNINLNATLDPPETKTNEPISLKVTFSGTGNLKLIAEPDLKIPSDFEAYDPKISNNYNASGKGFSGRKTFEYLLIPRHEGEYEIPAIELAVFDLETKRYKTLSAGPFQVKVAKGEGGDIAVVDPGLLKEEVEELGTDIRYIRTNDIALRGKDQPFFGSFSFYSSYLVSLGAFFLIFFVGRQQRRQSEDEVYMKNKKAGKVAQTRLKQAKTFMDQGQREAFYKEVLNAKWGYLSDKLNIPQGELNKGKIREALGSRNVEEHLINDFVGFMDRCEFAQFSPAGGSDELSKVYQEAADLIGKVEGALK